MNMWTLESALPVVRAIEPLVSLLNFHVALGGSVLHRGESTDDLDIIVYVSKKKFPANPAAVITVLGTLGFHGFIDRTPYHKEDTKQVFNSSDKDGRRVDFIFA